MKAGAETVGNIFFSQDFRLVFQRQTVLVKGSGLNFSAWNSISQFLPPKSSDPAVPINGLNAKRHWLSYIESVQTSDGTKGCSEVPPGNYTL